MNPATAPLAAAGLALLGSAEALKGAAAAQLVASGASSALMARMLPFLGTAGAMAIGAGAGSSGRGSPGYEYQAIRRGRTR